MYKKYITKIFKCERFHIQVHIYVKFISWQIFKEIVKNQDVFLTKIVFFLN